MRFVSIIVKTTVFAWRPMVVRNVIVYPNGKEIDVVSPDHTSPTTNRTWKLLVVSPLE